METLWIGNEKMREESYKAAMLTCEPVEWVIHRRGNDSRNILDPGNVR